MNRRRSTRGQVAGEVVVVDMRLEHVRDPHPLTARQLDNAVEVALCVDHERALTVVDQVTAIPERRGLDRNDRRCRHGNFPSTNVESPGAGTTASEQASLRVP